MKRLKNSSKNNYLNSQQIPLTKKRKLSNLYSVLITGHCKLNKHMRIMGLSEEAKYRFYQIDISEHVLCKYNGLARTIFQILGLENPQLESYMGEHLQRLIEIIKNTNLKS